ncbi:helix-turn-helix domain-containing protein, partial [Candidatus Kaiserbacteria bacterium]|nr:helix-turn-helix domain-containing protein [Candidatus Kaiserbacteria bacterium]
MEEQIFFDGSRYISANEAAFVYGLTRDYIGKLCREGKIRGKRVASRWYVSEESVVTFLLAQQCEKSKRRTELSELRMHEYRALQKQDTHSVSPIQPTIIPAASPAFASAVSFVVPENKEAGSVASQIAHLPTGVSDVVMQHAAHMPTHAVVPLTDILHRAAALFLVFVMVFGTYAAVRSESTRAVMASLRSGAGAVFSAALAPQEGADKVAISGQEYLAAAIVSSDSLFGGVLSFVRSVATNVLRSTDPVAFSSSLFNRLVLQPPADSDGISAQTAPPQGNAWGTPVSKRAPSAVVQNITNPVIERIVETQRVVTGGGVTFAFLDQRLQELDNKLSSQMHSLSYANNRAPDNSTIQSNSTMISQTNTIHQLTGTRLYNPIITGASIEGSASLTSLGVSGNATISGDLTVTGSITGGSSGSVTSITAGSGLLGGTINASGTIAIDYASGGIWTAASTTFTNHLSLNTASSSLLTISSLWLAGASTGCAEFDANGKLTSTGVNCGSGGGGASGGGWNAVGDAVNGRVTLATSTYLVAVGATTSPYAKLSVLSGSAGTTTLALVPATGQTANILDIYNTSGILTSVMTAGGNLGLGNTSPSEKLNVQGVVAAQYFNATSSTASTFTGGLLAQASSTFSALLNLSRASTTLATLSGTGTWLTGVTSALLATDENGKLVATTSLGLINGTSIVPGTTMTITAASSTLLANSNTFSGANTFSSTITGSVSGNAGTVGSYTA